jgi:molybdopterin-guanine dinucleotide biosynthesis protein A
MAGPSGTAADGDRVRIFGVILAGGQGRRLGGADKALLDLGGQTLLARAVARLGPQVEDLALSANGDPARFSAFGLPVLADAVSLGPLSGILAALDRAADLGATAVVSVAVDTPFFPEDLVPRLLWAAEAAPEGLALAETAGQVHPTFGLWPAGLRPDLRATLARGESRVLAFADRHGAARAPFADDSAFLNVNTPADRHRAEALLRGAPA